MKTATKQMRQVTESQFFAAMRNDSREIILAVDLFSREWRTNDSSSTLFGMYCDHRYFLAAE